MTCADATALGRCVRNAVQRVADEALSQYECIYRDTICSTPVPTAYEIHKKCLRLRLYVNIFADANFSGDRKLSFDEFMALASDFLKSYILRPSKAQLCDGASARLMVYLRKISRIASKSELEMLSKVDDFTTESSAVETQSPENAAFTDSEKLIDARKVKLATSSVVIEDNTTQSDTPRCAGAVHDGHKNEVSKSNRHCEEPQGSTDGNRYRLGPINTTVTSGGTKTCPGITDKGIAACGKSTDQSHQTTRDIRKRVPQCVGSQQ